ncbi:MAG: hypothetical protein LBK91_07570 [Synergistaceae bacterium]|jgi:hypothetical protein|nr:hypothetical protein [Synergistaceae bacterium]
MIGMENAIAVIDVVKRFPEDNYNILIPQATITQMSPFHRVSINIVRLDSDTKNGDVYILNKNLALAKKGIMKLAGAAGIQTRRIRNIDPSSCGRCKPSSACRDCPNKDDLAVEVEVLMPDGAGGYRSVIATREWLAEDERAAAASWNSETKRKEPNDMLFAQAKRFRKPMTESKALLRAVRAALSIKTTYTADELVKPFVVPVVTLNYEDPTLREFVAKRLASGVDAVFGAPRSVAALPVNVDIEEAEEREAIEEAEVVDTAGTRTGKAWEDADISNAGYPDETPSSVCVECGGVIRGFTSAKGKEWTTDSWIKYSVKQHGATLCPKCAYHRQQKEAAA